MPTEMTFTIQGMTTHQDADNIKHALHEVWGIHRVELSLARNQVTFTYDNQAASMQDFKQAVLDCGYDVVEGR